MRSATGSATRCQARAALDFGVCRRRRHLTTPTAAAAASRPAPTAPQRPGLRRIESSTSSTAAVRSLVGFTSLTGEANFVVSVIVSPLTAYLVVPRAVTAQSSGGHLQVIGVRAAVGGG